MFPHRRVRAYADTSVYGGVFDKEFARPSREFFDLVRIGIIDLVVSLVVGQEIEPAPPEIVEFFQEFSFIASSAGPLEDAVRLQEEYLQARILGPSGENDALHVALATVSNCDVLVSWNFKHIVHFQKIPLYNEVNRKEGYAPIVLCSPLEVIGYDPG